MSLAEKRVLVSSKHIAELDQMIRFILTDSDGLRYSYAAGPRDLRPPTLVVRTLILLSKGDFAHVRYLDAGVGALILTSVRQLERL